MEWLRLAEASRGEVEDERNALSQEIKIHRSALSALERLRRQGVMLDSVPSLDRLARKSGVPLNTLLRQLERYGSINKAVAILKKRRRALQGEGEHLKRQIDPLEAEKQGTLVEHYEMREDMLILSVGKQRASTEIANLGSIGELARTLLSRDPHEIGKAPPTFPVLLLIWTRGWLETRGQGDRKIPAHLTKDARWVSPLFAPSISELLAVVIGAIATIDQEDQQVPKSRVLDRGNHANITRTWLVPMFPGTSVAACLITLHLRRLT